MDPDTDCSAVIKTTSYSNSSLDDGAAMMYFQRRERKVEDGGKGGEREGVGRGGDGELICLVTKCIYCGAIGLPYFSYASASVVQQMH